MQLRQFTKYSEYELFNKHVIITHQCLNKMTINFLKAQQILLNHPRS